MGLDIFNCPICKDAIDEYETRCSNLYCEKKCCSSCIETYEINNKDRNLCLECSVLYFKDKKDFNRYIDIKQGLLSDLKMK